MEDFLAPFYNFHGAVISKFREITDPSAETAAEASRNLSLRAQLQQKENELKDLQRRRAEALQSGAAELEATRRKFEQEANPKLDALDVLDTAKLVYDQITTHAADAAYKVQMLQQNELKSYGYQSKMIASLAISLEALRHKMVQGSPFVEELQVASQELTDAKELTHVTIPLREFAHEGIAKLDQLTSEARGLLVTVDEAQMSLITAASSQAAAEQQAHRFTSWIARFKVDVPGLPPKDYSSTPSTAYTSVRSALASVTADLGANQLERALATLSSVDFGTVSEQAASLQRKVEGRLLADTALRFSDSMLSLHRFRFVEPVLSPGHHLDRTE